MNRRFHVALAGCLLFCAALQGQDNSIPARNPTGQIELPVSAHCWLNSPPLRLSDLGEKGAYLFTIEESKCNYWKATWPKMIAASTAFNDQPIVFIAVIAGSREKAAAYAKSCGITWPIIVFDPQDPSVQNQPGTLDDWLYWSSDRSRCWFNYHARLRLPNGKLTVASGESEDVDRLARQALNGARWSIDPAVIPPGLRDAWRAIEFGYAANAAASVRQGLRSKNKSILEAAEALQAGVARMAQDRLETAQALQSQGQDWKAYQALLAAKAQYAGFDLPTEFEDRLAEWQMSPQVQREEAAAKALALLTKKRSSTGTLGNGRAKRSLEKLIKDHPQTEAAERAKRILEVGTSIRAS